MQLGAPAETWVNPSLQSPEQTRSYLHCPLGELVKPDLITHRWVLGLEGANQRPFRRNDPPGPPSLKPNRLDCMPAPSERASLACVQPQRVPHCHTQTLGLKGGNRRDASLRLTPAHASLPQAAHVASAAV